MIVVNRTPVRDVSGKILGFIEEDKDGNQQCREFTGKILGFYNKEQNVTREFTGRIRTRGNSVIGFLYEKK